jgi:hypothetical protein
MPRTCAAVSPETGVNELVSKKGKGLFESIFLQTEYLISEKALCVLTQFYPLSGMCLLQKVDLVRNRFPGGAFM